MDFLRFLTIFIFFVFCASAPESQHFYLFAIFGALWARIGTICIAKSGFNRKYALISFFWVVNHFSTISGSGDIEAQSFLRILMTSSKNVLMWVKNSKFGQILVLTCRLHQVLLTYAILSSKLKPIQRY